MEIVNVYTAKGNVGPDGREHKNILTTGDRLSCLYYSHPANPQKDIMKGAHAHLSEFVYFVIEGEMDVSVNGEVATLKKGDAMMVPFNVLIGSRVISSTPAEILIFASPNNLPDELRLRGGPPDHSH